MLFSYTLFLKMTKKRAVNFKMRKSANKDDQKIVLIAKPLLIGSPTVDANLGLARDFFFSKNNIDIWNPNSIRTQLMKFYASFYWLQNRELLRLKKLSLSCFTIMFASISPVYAGLVKWAGAQTGGYGKGTRWLSGTISATIKIEQTPDFLFIPDISENQMIIKEANKKLVPIVAPVGTDMLFPVDFPIYSSQNNFNIIYIIINFFIRLAKQKPKLKNQVLRFSDKGYINNYTWKSY